MATAKRSAKIKQPRKRVPAAQGKSKEYAVGYKKPPKEYQWKPGQSGNPSGRHTTSHDELKKLIQEIGNEAHPDRPDLSRLEIMLRSMMVSKNATDHSNILEHGFGKVPQDVNVRSLSDDELVRHAADLAATLGLGSGGTPAPQTEPPGETSAGDPAKP